MRTSLALLFFAIIGINIDGVPKGLAAAMMLAGLVGAAWFLILKPIASFFKRKDKTQKDSTPTYSIEEEPALTKKEEAPHQKDEKLAMNKKTYTEEFKRKVADQAQNSGLSLSKVGEMYDVNPTLVRNWKIKFYPDADSAPNSDAERPTQEDEEMAIEQVARGSIPYLITFSTLPEQSRTEEMFFGGVDEIAELDEKTQIKVLSDSISELIGSISYRALKGEFSLIGGYSEKVVLGIYPETIGGHKKTSDHYPSKEIIAKAIKKIGVDVILENEHVAIYVLSDDEEPWESDFIKAQEQFGEDITAVGLHNDSGEVIVQEYSMGEVGEGYLSDEDEAYTLFENETFSGYQELFDV